MRCLRSDSLGLHAGLSPGGLLSLRRVLSLVGDVWTLGNLSDAAERSHAHVWSFERESGRINTNRIESETELKRKDDLLIYFFCTINTPLQLICAFHPVLV